MLKRVTVILAVICFFLPSLVCAEFAPQFQESSKDKTDLSTNAPKQSLVNKDEGVMENNVNKNKNVMEGNVNKNKNVMENNVNNKQNVMESNAPVH